MFFSIDYIKLNDLIRILKKHNKDSDVKHINKIAEKYNLDLKKVDLSNVIINTLTIPLLLQKYEIFIFILKFLSDIVKEFKIPYNFPENIFIEWISYRKDDCEQKTYGFFENLIVLYSENDIIKKLYLNIKMLSLNWIKKDCDKGSYRRKIYCFERQKFYDE